ncbi:UDP-N-acetylmuramoylalanyl-D-glutamate--2,6-diaminopimelate ligase [Propionispira arboris]|uniref:UDP-N-acetylmuramoyl-L-alanyl-D-glutamate--2,6-diaminopimelate ligase n=1 Tax=Propionispira arboris TaxID=84035 RepID=A0A1H7AP99_9FIRM|nr:UDP-N-acetylmuramoyl-L-alanyl-D-glutamate--2,6-diaminopimelate ligase [Propionispira arboris]SEJ63690.1 UDP-N-acetylmuramoylalanyl-D-glutamate--2,6-diaminopimelate ligase [Propionispira arboris]
MSKTIKELAALLTEVSVVGDENTRIQSIAHDSRKVTQDTLFVCISGATVDGHKFIAQAIENGAVAVLVEKDVIVPKHITVVRVPDVKAAMHLVVPYFYDYPARKMRLVGITGTNGKTTTSYVLRAILREAGYKVGLIGTIQIMIEDEIQPIHNTTPDVIDLQCILADMAKAKMDYVVMEVSSHALAQDRVIGCEFDTAVFTNLTQDHLDYHKTLENYAKAKARLFDLVSAAGQTKGNKSAVINIDDAASLVMLEHTTCQCLTYAIHKESDLRASAINVLAKGANFTISGAFGTMDLKLKITGIFNVYNVLSAVGAALAEKIAPQIIQATLEKFTSVPGRFELVDEGQDFSVIVDYAHTPDGLENILHTARQIAKKRIITVFGCGGDRDRTKRPIMGRIAAKLSDVVIATSDNPRTEDPEFILSQVEAGVQEELAGKPHEKIIDRKTAIFRAIEIAQVDDIVIIAGKGHENYQILKDQTIHFDDKEVARAAIRGKQ